MHRPPVMQFCIEGGGGLAGPEHPTGLGGRVQKSSPVQFLG